MKIEVKVSLYFILMRIRSILIYFNVIISFITLYEISSLRVVLSERKRTKNRFTNEVSKTIDEYIWIPLSSLIQDESNGYTMPL